MDTAKPVEKSLYTMVEKASLGTISGNYSYFAVFKKHSYDGNFYYIDSVITSYGAYCSEIE